MSCDTTPAPDPRLETTRRDLLFVCTGAFAAAGGAAALWPLIDQMNPHPGTPADSVAVDLAPIAPGQVVTVAWRGQPIVIRHRTPDEIARVRDESLENFPDPAIFKIAFRAQRAESA